MNDSKKVRQGISPEAMQRPHTNIRGNINGDVPSESSKVVRLSDLAKAHSPNAPDLVCFSHLRWDFVYQRPQHLFSRCAQERRVFFVEEPVYADAAPRLDISRRECGVRVVVPSLPHGLSEAEAVAAQRSLLIDDLFLEYGVSEYVFWYYTPMALAFTQHLDPLAVVYDCMDELSASRNAPPGLRAWEGELFKRADLVFTGGFSLYEAKRDMHPNVYPFPSSIDAAHFRRARYIREDPPDQSGIPFPRLGFCGVIDERLDRDLLDGLAQARPDWHFVMIGPVARKAALPRRDNIHYLGGKPYEQLPAYLGGWDVAMLPFARNESTRFLSPTTTLEYLAAGIPVISTSIRDVVRPYGQQGLVRIADGVADFIAAAEPLMSRDFEKGSWLRRVDEVLAYNSWDRTWARMMQMLNLIVSSRYPALLPPSAIGRQPLHSGASHSTN